MQPEHTKAEKVIQSLLLKGQEEKEILDSLKKKGLLTPKTEKMVHAMSIEFRAAKAFIPPQPSYTKIRIWGVFILAIGITTHYFFLNAPHLTDRGDPRGYATLLIIFGFIFIFFPNKGTDELYPPLSLPSTHL